MSDLAFEQMLAQYNQDYKDAEEFSDWMPDDGGYIVTITKVKKGISQKDGKTLGWWRITARIEDVADEKIHGEEFTLKFCSTKALGITKGFARSLNNGDPVSSLAEVDSVFEQSIGKVLDIKVSSSTSKKDGKEYTNCYVQKVVDAVDVVEEEQDSAGDAEVPTEDTAVDPA